MGPGAHEDGFGLQPSDEVRSPSGFTARVTRLLAQSDRAGATAMGLVLLVCEEDNIASVRTIERHGGALEGVQDTEHGVVRRYWITL